jgi:carboxypeptidase Q
MRLAISLTLTLLALPLSASEDPAVEPQVAADPQQTEISEAPAEAAVEVPPVVLDPGHQETSRELLESALTGTDALDLVRSLSYDVGPRSAGSTGDRAAVVWALDRMRSMGLSQIRPEPVEVPHWDRGRIEVETTRPERMPLTATLLGGSIGTSEAGLEAPVLRIEDLADLEDLSRGEVEGRIVYFARRMERSQDGSGYGVAVQARAYGAIEASRLGAAGIVIRSAGTSWSRAAHTGMMRYEDGVRRIPAAALANADADALERLIDLGEPVTLRIWSSARTLEPEMSANVIGEVPGRGELRDQIILLGAHLDSWDNGMGAQDDGTGVAIVLETAARIAATDATDRRTVRVVLFANEEFGLTGAKRYVEVHADELDQHVLAMEADFGAGQVWSVDSGFPANSVGIADAMIATLADLDIERGGNDSSGGADIGRLWRMGVPMLSPYQDGTLYFDVHHTPDDTPDRINREHLDQNVAVYTALTYLAATYAGDFGRLPLTPDETH